MLKLNKQNTKIILQIDEIGFYLECNDSDDLVLLERIISNKVIEKSICQSLSSTTHLAFKRLFSRVTD